MSELFDSQKKPTDDLRKQLQERLEKSNPRRTLAADESRRLSKLETIADKLKCGENVQNRQLQTWLSEDEYAQLEEEWQEQLELREELKEKPSDLKRYEEKLKQATFNYNRAEGYVSKGKHTTAKKFYDKSESFCEDALEILQEIFHYDSSLRVWFDRDLNFEIGSELSAEIVSLPRKPCCRGLYQGGQCSKELFVGHYRLNLVSLFFDQMGLALLLVLMQGLGRRRASPNGSQASRYRISE